MREYLRRVNVLALDQGTSSTKALVVAESGVVLSEAEVAVHSRSFDGDAVEQDAEELFDSLLDAGRQAVARSGVAIHAVGLANQGETILCWERGSGRPLSPAISWQDRRAAALCTQMSVYADELRQITGLPLDPYFSGPKIAWLRQRGERDGLCTTTDAWLLHRLCGAYVTDAATASRTLLLDLDAVRWSERACTLFGVDVEQLPAIVDCAGVVGETSAFGPVLRVSGVAVDQQAALFGEACFEPGDMKCTYGTGAFLLATEGRKASRSRSGLVNCVAWRLDGETTYCLDGQVYTVGAAVDWLQRVGVISSPADLDDPASQTADSGGVAFVPALAGLAAPFWRPTARGALTGLSLATEKSHLVRAFLEGIAAQVAWLARAASADLSRSVIRLRADGGLTRSRALMQLQADLLQAPVEVYPSPHATALGVAALARLGAGAAHNPTEAVGVWKPAAIYEPSISAAEAEERLDSWRRIAEATMEFER